MDRISTASKAVDLFGVNKHGFRDGDLAGGIAPTSFNAAWFNGMQEEIARVIEAAGIALNAGVLNQLLLALRSAGVFQTAAVGDSTTKAATTAFVIAEIANQFNKSGAQLLAGSGYQKLPGGLILQWGKQSVTSGAAGSAGGATGAFPLAFPTACLFITGYHNSADSTYSNVSASATSTTQFSVGFINGVGVITRDVEWIAIGH